jgi:hypothetical protein
MGFIYTLLGVDVPAGTAIEDVELQFRSPLPWFVVVLLVLVLAAGVGVVYWHERAKVNFFARLLLALVRTAALVLLLLLLCRPVLQATFVGPRSREILLLIDNTQSMKQQDRRVSKDDERRVRIALGPNASVKLSKNPSRADLVKAVLANTELDLLAGLQKHGPVVPMLFGANAQSALKDYSNVAKRTLTAQDVLAKFTAEESETALADVIKTHLQRKDADLPVAIVVFTDGRDTVFKYTLDEAAKDCADLGVPLHIYGVGSSEGGSLKMSDLLVDDTLFAKDEVPVVVRWRADGITAGTAVVTVKLAGLTQTRKVPITAGREQEAEFIFALPDAKEKGKVQNSEASATVELLQDATYKDSRNQPVRIVDGKVRVLFVEYMPRKDFKFLEPILLDDHRIEPRFWLITADPKAMVGGPFEKEFPKKKDLLNKFDLVILGDVPADKLTEAQRKLLADYVDKDRGGLLVLAGRQHMPASYADSAFKEFAQLLPVIFVKHTFSVAGPGSPLAYQPQRTPSALRAKWLQLDKNLEENDKLWQGLPGFYWHYPVNDLRGGAEVLLEHPTAKMEGGALDKSVGSKDKQAMPLLVWHRVGKGQVMFAGFEETWRWRFNTDRKVFGRFWSQVILRMALQHKGIGQVELEVNRSAMELGKPGKVYARLLKANFEPLTESKVIGELTYLDDKSGVKRTEPVVLEPVPEHEKEGLYHGTVPNDRPGLWQVTLTQPDKAVLTFNVKVPEKHELKEASMAAEVLRSAAKASGGRFYQEESLHELVSFISPRETTFRLRQEVLLWGWIPFLLFVGLMTCEWVARKFANMS